MIVSKRTVFFLCVALTFIVGLVAASSGPLASTGTAAETFVCVPTCSTTDGRFLALAGSAYQTLGVPALEVQLIVPGTADEVRFDIFDGDSSEHWDWTDQTLVYTLYADPNANGTGTVQVAQWQGSTMPNNAWHVITRPVDATALADDGSYYYYRLITRLPDASARDASSFKFRTTSGNRLYLRSLTFTFAASLTDPALEGPIIYPDYPNLTPTTYDGTWEFLVYVPSEVSSFQLWDGDLDFGAADCSVLDTDDPDTPNEVLQPWMQEETGARLEGVAVAGGMCPDGVTQMTGDPPDDNSRAWARRTPSIQYTVVSPDGRRFNNTNPSGNQEWEQFRIETLAGVPADYHVDQPLPAGRYRVQLEGVDLANLNALHMNSGYRILCETEAGEPCPDPPDIPLAQLGGTIWLERDEDGIYEPDDGEAALAEVGVTLFDDTGTSVGATTTGSDGSYLFSDVPNGTYTVRLDPASLAGMIPVADSDGVATPHEAVITVANGASRFDIDFAYRTIPLYLPMLHGAG